MRRLQDGDWPAPGTVTDLYGTWAAAHADASGAVSADRRSSPLTRGSVEDDDEDGSQRFADLIPQTTAAAGRRRTARGPR